MIEAALRWVRENSLPGSGIVITSRQRVSYAEVSGYFMPTLLATGEAARALDYAKWLVRTQKSDGSFGGGGASQSFAFDTAQVVRGWTVALQQLPSLEMPLRRACDWLLASAESSGRLPVPAPGGAWSLGVHGEVSEAIHLYCLGPLLRAGELLGERRYVDFAQRAADWYCKLPDLGNFRAPGRLSHFHAYVMEALCELDRTDLARKGMDAMRAFQQDTGAVPGYHDVKWICTTGLAQLAQVWYMLGDIAPADAALDFLGQLQNASGGFFGSVGPGADYFPGEEISWACKYAIEAQVRRIGAAFDKSVGEYSLEVDPADGRVQAVLSALGELDGKRVLDAGCGSGRYLRLLSRRFPGASLSGCDLSPAMLSRLPEAIDKRQGTLLSLPYPDGSFDAVLCVEALEHCPDPARACREMARLLAPGGRLVVIDKDVRLEGVLATEPWERWFASEEVVGWLSEAGLDARCRPVASPANAPEGLFLAWSGTRVDHSAPLPVPVPSPRPVASKTFPARLGMAHAGGVNFYRTEFVDEFNRKLVEACRRDDRAFVDAALFEQDHGHPHLYDDEKFESRFGMQEIFDAFRGKRPRIVLDVACGNGELLARLRQEGHEVFGIDVSRIRVEGLRSKIPTVQTAFSEAIPLPSGSFDAVIAQECLEHVMDLDRSLREICRLLKPGGLFFCQVPLGSFADGRNHVRLFDEELLRWACQEIGFAVRSVRVIPYLVGEKPSNLSLVGVKGADS